MGNTHKTRTITVHFDYDAEMDRYEMEIEMEIEMEEDELFWKTLAEAKAEGKIELPEFPHSPFEDDKQRLERLTKQREKILKAYEIH